MHATVMSWCLFALMITGCCRLVSSQVTIGFTSGDRDGVFLVMENETAEVCIAANFNSGADPDKTVRTAYMSRSAVAGMDFVDTQITLTLSTSMPQTCFSIVLINDNIFEARREEFFVNITTSDNSVTLMPNFIAVNINDDELLYVSLNQPEYTVREDEGELVVCISLQGNIDIIVHASNIQTSNVTAYENIDYRRLLTEVKFFPGRKSTLCFTIVIILDIAFENTKEFQVELVTPGPGVNIFPYALSRIVILDYNAIVQQQPKNVFDGLNLPNNFTCVIKGNRIKCSQNDTIITLIVRPCAKSILLTVKDKGITILNEVLMSMPQSQTLTTEGDKIHLDVSLEVVSSDGSEYFIITLNSSVRLDFPTTAIPIDCSADGGTDGGMIGGIVGGILLVISAVLAAIIAVMLYRKYKENIIEVMLHSKRELETICTRLIS